MSYARGQPSVSAILSRYPFLAEIAPGIPDLDRWLRVNVPDGAHHRWTSVEPGWMGHAFAREQDADSFVRAFVGRRISPPAWWRT